MKHIYSPGWDLQAAAQKVQKRMINKPRHPAQLAADIVERVVATGGEPYLGGSYLVGRETVSGSCCHCLSLCLGRTAMGYCYECSYTLVRGC